MSPIGGVLFAMEEGASFWSIQLMWKCVSASTTTILVWYFLEASKRGFGPQEIPLKVGLDNAGSVFLAVHYWEYCLLAAVGVAAGLIGGCWVNFNIRLTKLRMRLNFSKSLQLLEVMFFTVLSKWN